MLQNDSNKNSIFHVNLFIHFISAKTNHNYSHILRMIYQEFLNSSEIIHGDFKPDVLLKIYNQILQYILLIPSYDQCFNVISNERSDDSNHCFTFQELFNLMTKKENIQIKFVFGTRTTNDYQWKDAQLATCLIQELLGRNLSVKSVSNLVQPAEIIGLLIQNGIQHQNHRSEFIKLAEDASFKIPRNDLFVGPLQNEMLAIFAGAIRSFNSLSTNDDDPLLEFIFEQTLSFSPILKNKFKINFVSLESFEDFKSQYTIMSAC